MEIYFNDKFLEFSCDDLDRMYLSEGQEGKVYRYGDEALKIYKSGCTKFRLDEDSAIKLSQISTDRVLLPRNIIYDANGMVFNGYSTIFIDRRGLIEVLDMSIEQLVSELDIINNDLEVLSDNGVLVSDFNLCNLLYDGRLFLGDPGSYEFMDFSPDELYRRNSYEFSNFVINGIFNIEPLDFISSYFVSTKFSRYDNIGDQIRANAKDGETVKQYVKRISE